MPHFQIKAYEVHSVTLNVEAEDAEEAREKANAILEAGEYDDGTALPEAEYEFTQDSDDWPVYHM